MRLTKEQMDYQLKTYWLSRREAATMLGTTGEWIHALAKQGELEVIETGLGRLYSKQDIERLAAKKANRKDDD